MVSLLKPGAQVFVFFEAGDLNKPVYFAAAQSGPGWFAEHPNQHVFHSDNIRVRIDEDPAHPDSTCKFNTYNDKNNVFSINDGTKTERQTRLDIEVLAKNINAVNVQIHGDVNMKILGDWYVHHEGNKHETHIGDHYVKHIGDTVIEEEGITIFDHIGDYQQHIDGNFTEWITKDYSGTIEQDSTLNIGNNSEEDIGGSYTKLVSDFAKYQVIGNEEHTINGALSYTIGDKSNWIIAGEYTIVNDGQFSLKSTESISLTSRKGNIDLYTQGEFEIADGSGNITGTGYKNLGTLGNIRLKSTFGNISLKTIENKQLVDLEQEYTCIAWNPSYLNQMGIISKFIPGFDSSSILKPVSAPTDLASFLIFLTTAVMYDGFPSFLPTKMIMQNPNITPPSGDFLAMFRSIDDDWQNITNVAYWKLISKVVGNIDIESWSGDINIKTEGTLGNGGNINLIANNKYGALPGYEVGNVKIIANTPFRIYTDPRDLFLDTHLLGKLTGQFSWFSSVGGIKPAAPPISIKPLNPVQAILSLLGIPFQFGFASPNSGGGGCMQCITDVITQTAVDLMAFSALPWAITNTLFLSQPEHHKFNAVKGSFMHKDIIQGSVSLLKKQSNGFGHAVDKFGLDEIYGETNYSFGNVLINAPGSYELNVGKNAKMTAKTGDWQFGVNSKVETGWIEPSKGLNPIDAILGESPLAFPGKGVCEPVISKIESNYFNQFNNQKFGNYSSTFHGFTNTGVYMLPLLPIGCFGFEISDYVKDVPWIYFHPVTCKLKLSSLYSVENQPYIVDADNFNVYLNKVDDGISIYTDIEENLVDKNASKNTEPAKPSKPQDKKPEKTPEEKANALVSGLNNSYFFRLGNEDWNMTVSGKQEFCKLNEQLPNTAAAVSMAVPIVSLLAKVIPGIGDAAQQAAKMLPYMIMPKETDFYFNTTYLAETYSKQTYKAWMIQSEQLSGGLLSQPESKPMLYFNQKLALPDIAGVADGLLSLGSAMDPIGTLKKLFIEELPNAVASTEANITVGIAPPKPLADGLGIDDLVSAKMGLFKGAKFQTTVNLLDSEFDRKAAFINIDTNIPLPPKFDWKLNANIYALTNGIDAQLEAPVINGMCKVSLLKDSLALTTSGPLKPACILVIGGKEIINFPKGGAGLLGGGLIKAILGVFF